MYGSFVSDLSVAGRRKMERKNTGSIVQRAVAGFGPHKSLPGYGKHAGFGLFVTAASVGALATEVRYLTGKSILPFSPG